MKRFSVIILAAMLCIGAAGCSKSSDNDGSKASSDMRFSDKRDSLPESSQPSETESSSAVKSDTEKIDTKDPDTENSDTEQPHENVVVLEVADKDGKHIGEIKSSGAVTLTDSGLFFMTRKISVPSDNTAITTETNSERVTSYHLYDPEKNERYDLGDINGEDYEAGYDRTEINGRLYTLITTGNALDNIPDPLILLEFDLNAHSVRQYKISDNGFPYTAMTEVNGKLLILNHDQQEQLSDRLYLFDTQTGESEQVLQFELNNGTGDTIRQVWCDGEDIYILRLEFANGDAEKMFIDTYGKDFKKLYEKDITSVIRKSAEESLASDDVRNEMKQMVSGFRVIDKKYVYYENFSAVHFLADIESGKLFDEINELSLISSGSGKPFFYYIYKGNAVDYTKGENAVFELKNGSLEKTVFSPDDERYYITSASVSPNGKRLIQTDYTSPDDRSDTLPAKLYYF